MSLARNARRMKSSSFLFWLSFTCLCLALGTSRRTSCRDGKQARSVTSATCISSPLLQNLGLHLPLAHLYDCWLIVGYSLTTKPWRLPMMIGIPTPKHLTPKSPKAKMLSRTLRKPEQHATNVARPEIRSSTVRSARLPTTVTGTARMLTGRPTRRNVRDWLVAKELQRTERCLRDQMRSRSQLFTTTTSYTTAPKRRPLRS